jgi:hypothetical protein
MSEMKTVFTDSATKIKNKAHTDVSMLFTWVVVDDDGREKFNQAILPLADIHLRHDDTQSILRIDISRKVLPLPIKMSHIFVCVCDDPEQDWTGDWAHLGSFRVRAIMHKCVLTDDSDWLEFASSRHDCETETFEIQNGFAIASDEYVSLLRSPEYKGVVLPGMFK